VLEDCARSSESDYGGKPMDSKHNNDACNCSACLGLPREKERSGFEELSLMLSRAWAENKDLRQKLERVEATLEKLHKLGFEM
jgi:hypothetical protein